MVFQRQCVVRGVKMLHHGLTFGHEQEARWLWTSHIAVGAQVPGEHADVHLYCWHIWDGPQS